jgi:hypothetical protein
MHYRQKKYWCNIPVGISGRRQGSNISTNAVEIKFGLDLSGNKKSPLVSSYEYDSGP